MLEEWLATETRFAGEALLRAVSATHLLMERPGFGQRITPLPGSVLASVAIAHYDPDPDYFFHWFRDAAVVTDALRTALAAGSLGDRAARAFRESVGFALALRTLDGAGLTRTDFRARIDPAYLRYVRPDAELAALSGDTVPGDVRVNPDGTPDITRWSRPQSDGPALRALDALRWWHEFPAAAATRETAELIRADLSYTLAHAGQPCFDVWEEERGLHLYTLLLQAEALARGGAWLEGRAHAAAGAECRRAARTLGSMLPRFWDAGAGHYRSRDAVTDGRSDGARRDLDVTVILAVLHAAREDGELSVLDPKSQATLAALEQLFEAAYDINRRRAADEGPALGRYANDRYYSGGAYYFATLAAAEFYYRLATALERGARFPVVPDNERFRARLGTASAEDRSRISPALIARGDAILRTVRRYTPASGELSEQFDQRTGDQSSARALSWSYAALITAAAARQRACRATRA